MRRKALFIVVCVLVVFAGSYLLYQNWTTPLPDLESGDIIEITHPKVLITGKLILHNVWEFDRVYYFVDYKGAVMGPRSATTPSLAIKKSTLQKWGYKKVGWEAVTSEDINTYEEWQHMGKGQGTLAD